MNEIKSFIITLISVLILITAIEMIAPDNSLKKYLKFVLGIIIIAIIISPILSFFKKGEENIEVLINNYINLESKETLNSEVEKQNNQKAVFKKNLETNCNELLKEKFEDMEFETFIDCDIDTYNIEYSINSIEIKVKDKKISKVEQVIIGKSNEAKEVSSKNEEIKNKDEILKYLSDSLNISKEKINIYK